jgi:beta-glucanase (GH16 family)
VRRLRTMLATALSACMVVGTLALINNGSADAAAGPLTWSDEFDGPAGQAPNQSKWKYDIGGGGWGNNELEYYTSSTSNAALDGNGNLVITARRENPAGYSCWYGSCQYTSARLLTADRFTQAYGRFEARIKIPRGQGLWPAFWMLGNDIGSVGWPNSGEIDIMENVGFEPSTVHGTIHGPGYSGAGGLGGGYTLPGGQQFANDFHTFTVDWASDSITWYVDGQQYVRKTPADLGGNRWVFNHPFFMIMNVAVGGSWPGNPDGSTVFPQQMVIDYVRVYSAGSNPPPPPPPPPPSGAGPIVGVASNRCVDIPGGNPVDGAQLQLWDCNGTGAQQWRFEGDGTVRALGKCMDVANGSTANGAVIQLVNCNGNAAQKFVLNAAGDLVNPQSNRCVDAQGGGTANGTKLLQWDCHGGNNQKWRAPAVARPIVGVGSNRCIDIPGGNPVDGAQLQLWDCNGTGAQQWSFQTDGTVRALGKCMDVAGGSTANGAVIQLVGCNGNAAQRFVFTSAGDLVNPQSNKCVDAQGSGTANGTKLTQWDCHGGSNQKWRW